jgi:hypothetical protein
MSSKKKKDEISDGISEWKHSQVSSEDDIDGLTDILTREIDRDVYQLEKKLANQLSKKKSR